MLSRMLRAAGPRLLPFLWAAAILLLSSSVSPAFAEEPGAVAHRPGAEANLVLPDLNTGDFFGMTGHRLLLSGLLVCVFGLAFGLFTYAQVKKLPVHRSMAEISELIYATCKTYLIQQGKLILILELFIGTIIVAYFALIGFSFGRIVI